jgi:Concanavalin A-like lectin/glucanases superfamily
MHHTSQCEARAVGVQEMSHCSSPRIARTSFAIALWMLLMPISQLEAQRQALSLPTLFHFDGSSYMTLADSPALAPTSQITIAAWIKPDFSVSNVVDTILDKRDGCGFNRSYQLGIIKTYQNYTPGTIFFAASNANTDDLISTVPVPNDGRFHHVAGTYDGAHVKVFLDGVLVGQGTHTGPISTTSDPAVIGIQAGCGDLTYADIGPVKIFDHALPDDQIMADGTGGFALLNGGNSFVGNQNVAGVITASSFSGDGSGLSNISASNISSGTASIDISGIAASAVTASSALNAVNSSNLAGVAASNYARRDVTNTFQANQSIMGSLVATGDFSSGGSASIGSGTPILRHLSATFDPSLALLKPSKCTSTQVSLADTDDGDTVSLGVPNSRMGGGGELLYTAWASSAGTVTIRVCNLDPNLKQTSAGTGSIRVDIWKH